MPTPKKRDILPLSEFLDLTPTVLVPKGDSTTDRVPMDTTTVLHRIIDLKNEKDSIEEREKPLRAVILTAIRELGIDGIEVPYSSEYAYIASIVNKENTSISAELLLAAGVDPAVIKACTKTTPSSYLEARSKKLK